jgi:OOP family OmpA-OmpF porin
MMKTIAACALALFGLSPLVASADGPWYVGAGAGESTLESGGFDDSATSWKVFGGYQFHDSFAAEVGYLDSGEAKETVGIESLSISTDGITASLVGMLPIGETFSVHARLGMFFWDAEATFDDGVGGVFTASQSGEDPYYGVGGGMALGENAGLRLEYEIADIDDVDVSMISLSVLFRF